MMDNSVKTHILRAVLGLGIVVAIWLIFFEMKYRVNAESRPEVLIPCAVAILLFTGGLAIVPNARDIEEREQKVAVREAKLREERKNLDEHSSRQKAEDQKLRNEERRISAEIRELDSTKAAVTESKRANEEYTQKLKKEQRRLAKELEIIASQQSIISDKEKEIECERERIAARERAFQDRESRVQDTERQLERLQVDHHQRLQILETRIDGLTNDLTELESQKSQKQLEVANLSCKIKVLDDRDEELRAKQENLESDRKDLKSKSVAFECEKRDLENAMRSIDSEFAAIQRTKNQLNSDHEKLLRDRQRHQSEVESLASRIADHAAEKASLTSQLKTFDAERLALASEQEQAALAWAKASSLEKDAAIKAAKAAEDLRMIEVRQSEIKQFFDRTWHSAVGEHSVEPTIESLQSDAVKNPNAAMVLANVHILGAANRSEQTRTDFNQLVGPLRGIGRFLAAYLRDRGAQPAEVIQNLTVWATALNAASDGRYEIMVPSKDETFRGSSMESREDGIDQVSEVHNWAISNDRSIIAHRAEVL